ncbi:MAG: monovalent cation/H+ antiporter subunit D [Steroidobacteraceae bacterium]
MNAWLEHLPSLPIVAPLLAGALMLLFPEHRRAPRLTLALVSTLVQLAAAIAMLVLTTDAVPAFWPEGIGVYAIGGWRAPFGIVLVADRLSALMLTLNAVLALAVVVHSVARWDRIGVHYHPLLQFLLMGLNGAFLTGDLFNLFVFFEILLAASYALLLHGGGTQRMKMALHFVIINLVAAFAFLLGVAMLYSVLGTLNMADIAARWATLPETDRGIATTGASVLAIAFLIKAGSWPLNFWLPGTYAAAGAPVAAAFAIATKVGIYAILRLSSLVDTPGASFGEGWLFALATATMLFGIVGILAARQLSRLIAFTVVLSSGTLLAAAGLGSPSMTAPALFYLVGSVMASGAFFMLAGMTERMRTASIEAAEESLRPPASYNAFSVGEPPELHAPDAEVGIAIPAAMAFLGLNFVCCALLVTGLPPLSGFVAKVALAAAAIDASAAGVAPWRAWTLVTALLAGGFAGMIALARAGMRLFWSVTDRNTPRLRIVEAAPLAFLILVCLGLTAGAGPAMRYFENAARDLNDPGAYIRAVLGARPEARP